jgi:hypothetical protein
LPNYTQKQYIQKKKDIISASPIEHADVEGYWGWLAWGSAFEPELSSIQNLAAARPIAYFP